MAVELVTGYSGTAHVSSSEDGARQAGTVGTGMYVLETVDDPLAATLENANKVTVGPGDVLINGRHVRLTGSTTYAVPVGTQGMQTSNLLVLRYSVNDDGTEKVEAVTLTGEPAASDPQDPELAEGSILDGDSPVDMALYRVVTTGIESAKPVRLFSTTPPISGLPGVGDNVLDVAHGGTGATSAAAARINLGITPANIGAAASSHNHSAANITSGTLPVSRGGTGVTTDKAIALKAYPVGAVYISYVSTSPASLFGGTWTAITGRFPYFNAGTGTGGSNSQTINFNHTHRQTDKFTSSYKTGGNGYQYTNGGTQTSANVATGDSAWSGGESANNGTKIVLGNKTISTVPSYQTFYAWRRTA